MALAGSLALAPAPKVAGAAPVQLLPVGEDPDPTTTTTTAAPTTTTAPPATTEPVPTTAETVPTTQDTVAPTTTQAPPVTAAPAPQPTAARPVPTTAAPVTTTEPETITTTIDLLVPGDGTEGAQSTTTTVRSEAREVQVDRGLDDSTLVAFVIGGLVVLALILAALTWRYWAATRPVLAREDEPDETPADAAGPDPQPASGDSVGADGETRPGDPSADPTDPAVSSTAR